MTLTRAGANLIDDDELNLERLQQELRLAIATLTSYDNFIEEIKSYRCVYPDFVEPLLAAALQLVHGFQLRIALFRKLCNAYEHQRSGVNVAQILLRLAKLPIASSRIDAANYYVEDEVHRLLSRSFEEHEDTARKDATFNMLKMALVEMSNVCQVRVKYLHVFEKDLFGAYNRLVEKFVDAWKQQQIDVEIKKNEEESLYKIK